MYNKKNTPRAQQTTIVSRYLYGLDGEYTGSKNKYIIVLYEDLNNDRAMTWDLRTLGIVVLVVNYKEIALERDKWKYVYNTTMGLNVNLKDKKKQKTCLKST